MLRYQKELILLPVIASVIAVLAIGTWGMTLGIDLKGGSLLEVSYPDGRPTTDEIRTKVATLDFGEVRVQPTETKNVMLRARDLKPNDKTKMLTALGEFGKVEEVQFNSVGPTIPASTHDERRTQRKE